ncbi:MAG: prepilin-type N-terminal cleavage/methylation domain-containing protein [Arcobacteraceae bacterium]
MKPSLKKGFSIIELIFVIAVLGIIAAVAVPKLLDSRSSALATTIKQDISTITNSIQSYYMLNGELDDIAQSVNINKKTWKVTVEKAIFPLTETGIECVSIEIVDKELKVDIDEDNETDVCKKLVESGIEDATYKLY